MSFDMKDYKEVPERIAEFVAEYPLGSLQGEGYFVRDVGEKIVGYHYTAQAYRTPDDPRPGVGTAYEKIPGSTPYTKDSEVMNAETSAWGRAIVALGFSTKKIASANEVRARQGSDEGATGLSPSQGAAPLKPPPSSGTFQPPAAVQEDLALKAGLVAPTDGGVPEEVVMPFGKFAGLKLGDLVESQNGYVRWLAEKYEAKNPDQRRVKGAAQTLLSLPVTAGGGGSYDEDIPFQRTT